MPLQQDINLDDENREPTTIIRGNWSWREPPLKDGDIIKGGNFSQSVPGTEICKDNITLMEMGKFCSIMESNEEVKGVVDYFVEWDYNFLLTNYIKEVLKRYETQ